MLHVLGHPHARGLVEPGLRVGPAALRVHGNAVGPKTGDIDEKAEPFKNYYVALGFTVLRYIVLLGLYGGIKPQIPRPQEGGKCMLRRQMNASKQTHKSIREKEMHPWQSAEETQRTMPRITPSLTPRKKITASR